MTWYGLEVQENIFFPSLLWWAGGWVANIVFHPQGFFLLVADFPKKKERKKKVTKIHYARTLEPTARKQFRTKASENLWFKEK